MIPYDIHMNFEDFFIPRLKEFVMTKAAFIRPLGKSDYIVYDNQDKEVFWLHFTKKQENSSGQSRNLLDRIVTQYTTHYLSVFKPEDVNGLIVAVESAYKKQQEYEMKNARIREANKRRVVDIEHRKHQLVEMDYLDRLVR